MAGLISSICCTLIILAFCQIIVETVLPEGGTKRYVMFIAGIVAVTVIVSAVVLSGPDILKSIYAGNADVEDIAERSETGQSAGQPADPYRDYLEKLIDAYR